MIAAGDIAINRLHIRASKRDAQFVTNDLLNGSWSVADHEQWLFIRNITIASDKFGLRQHASEAVSSAISQAVDGRLSGAATANVVRFQSYVEMLAYLLRDLADGNAIQRWFWQRWRYLMTEPRSQAVARALWENAEYLGAVVEQLIAIDRLDNIWRLLTHQSAHQIIQQMQPFAPGATPAASIKNLSSSTTTSKARLLASALQSNPVLHDWVGPLAGIDTDDNRFRLAALITGVSYYPLYVSDDREMFVQTFADVYGHLCAIEDRVDDNAVDGELESMALQKTETTDAEFVAVYPRSDTTDDGTEGILEHEAKDTRRRKNNGRHIPITPAVEQLRAGSKIGYESEKEHKTTDSNTACHIAIVARDSPIDQHIIPEKQRDPERADNRTGISGETFFTQCGGIFYLINAIRDDTCQAILTGRQKNNSTSGWIWLYELARLMCAELDTNLLCFIANQCGFRNTEELLSLPSTPEMVQIEAIMSARYDNETVWSEALVSVPAKVSATASHVDVYYAFQSVRLPIRLAGLDVNPGWISWLGRVITLHYVDSPALR
jgi:hypothetical protein